MNSDKNITTVEFNPTGEQGKQAITLAKKAIESVRNDISLNNSTSACRKCGKKHPIFHSCGGVDELFDDLIAAGLNCFNPFQPEVMDVDSLLPQYRGRLAFHGGMSTQRTLPFGTVEDVKAETRRLLELGAEGSYIFAPAHDVEGDVPLENMLAAIEIVQGQPGFRVAQTK